MTPASPLEQRPFPRICRIPRTAERLATSKLAPGLDTNYRKDQGKDLDLAQLAVLDIRLLLAFEPNAKGLKAQEDMVASRMRIAHSVPKHHEYMRSSYPSELAEAAAHICAKYQQEKKDPEAVILMFKNMKMFLDVFEYNKTRHDIWQIYCIQYIVHIFAI